MHRFATLLVTFVSMGAIASLGAAEEAGDPLKTLGERTVCRASHRQRACARAIGIKYHGRGRSSGDLVV